MAGARPVLFLASSLSLAVLTLAAASFGQQPPPPGASPPSASGAPPSDAQPGSGEPPAPAPALPPPGYAPPAYGPGAPPPAYGQPGYPPPGYGPYEPPPPGYGPYAYPPGPAYVGPPPPLPRSRRPGYHLHDGFYLRMGLGLGYHRSRLSGLSSRDETLRGFGPALDIAIGGSPVPGLVIAADLGGHGAARPSSSVDAPGLAPRDVNFSRFGVLVDVYPMPREGLHVLGGVGAGQASYWLTGALDQGPFTLSGFSWNVGMGYETWVGAEWSLGAQVRIDGASMKGSASKGTSGETMTMLAPSLLFALTYH